MEAPHLPFISSFIIRFVVDESSSETTSYHGTVRHIQTAEEISFTEWREATEFMRRFVRLDELQPPSTTTPQN